MKTINDITLNILRREGGYVNDPDDPGGETKYGVTLKTLQRLQLDINHDGRVDSADLKKLDKQTAGDIFKRHYYFAPKINRLPQVLQASVFDMYVNAGSNAIKILQRLVSNFGTLLHIDGIIGAQTLKATKVAMKQESSNFVNTYGIARRNYYYALGDKNPKLRKYAKRRDGGKGGWITRAEEFIAPQFHLNAKQHAEKIKHWQ